MRVWRWRVLARNGFLVVLGLGALSALLEHILERRDAARLTSSDTFYEVGGRRIRYHQTAPQAPGPTVVLISGLTASLEQWSGVQSSLGTVTPVVSYDRGGTGFSDPLDAHDANAGAEELDQLLRSAEIAGPFVLVSYSSSSMLAIVFAARHPDLVKGMVFVDPAEHPPAMQAYRRMFLRPSVVLPLQAFFGLTRLKLALSGPGARPPSLESEHWYAAIESSHHWLASSYEAMRLDESANEADAAMATRPFAHLPLGVLTTMDPSQSELLREVFELQKKLAASSEEGILRSLRGDHNQLMNDPVAIASVVDLIHTIVEEARAK